MANTESDFQETDEKELKQLGQNTQNNIEKVKRINEIARYYINTNDLIGKVYETIQNNINTNIKLDWPVMNGRNKSKKKAKAENIVAKFLGNINVEKLLKTAISLTYVEGNYFMYLRNSGDNQNYTIDHYGLGIIEISDYALDDDNLIVFDVNGLKTKLQQNNNKYRTRNGQNLFNIANIDDEIKKNYPNEVYTAYKNNEKYALLDINNCGLLKINDLGGKYGVTPLFRAFKPLLILDVYDNSNMMTAKTRAKKILIQGLSDKLIDTDSGAKDTNGFQSLAYAHNNLVQAFKASKDMVMATTPGYVTKVYFVESNTEQVDINLINNQRDKILTALGISFLANESKSSFNTVDISVEELRKNINSIALQLSKILEKWIRIVLRDNNIPTDLCPKVQIESSTMLDNDEKRQLADDLFNKYGASFRTVYKMLGFDYETEKEHRKQENSKNLDTEVFYGRANGYTTSSSDIINKNNSTNKKDNENDNVSNNDKKNYDKNRQDSQK